GLGRHHRRVARADLDRLAAVRREGATPSHEVTELLPHDLPAPAPRRAFPYPGLDAVTALDTGGRSDSHRLAQRDGDRIGHIQNDVGGVTKMGNVHGDSR